MTYAEYEKLPGIRWSTLRAMAASALHYFTAVKGIGARKETRPMRLGRAVHCLLLDGRDMFDERWVEVPAAADDRRTKAYKIFAAANVDREILTRAEMRLVVGVAGAIARHRIASRYLVGAREQTVTWRDSVTGLRCKARVDLLTTARVLDLKSTGRLGAREFARTAANLGYHCQLAHYEMGLRANRWQGEPEPILLGVETAEPFDVVVYEVPTVAMEAGRREVRRLLDLVAECEKKGEWPGRAPDRIVPLELPEWAFGGFDDGLDFSGLEEVTA